jgi:hypothetical protein
MNATEKPIRKLTAAQSAWLAANGIETYEDSCITGLGFFRAANESSVEFFAGRWELEERDYCENGDGVKAVGRYATLRAALKALVAHKQTACGCCAA